MSVLTTGWAALATVALLYPGFGTAHPDDALPEGFAHQRGAFETSQFVPLAGLLLLGVLFYWSGRETRAQQAELPITSDPSVAPALT
ncbi:MAG TPA: hypothetical protein VFY45_00380 [Baekduia sp.]|nr:hypothetical protein [Baekduia sp.]